MSDRDLLELAAKAAGILGEYVTNYYGDSYYQGNTKGILYKLQNGKLYVWNPLIDAGDALRLAVDLGIDIQQFKTSRTVEAWTYGIDILSEDYCNDPYAATRRAIVRAAAEIGKEMK